MKKKYLLVLIIIFLITFSFYFFFPDKVLRVKKETVLLYYYNSALDKDEAGNILCSQLGLVPVSRQIPISDNPIEETIKLLLKGELTPSEEELGLSSEYPLEGFSLIETFLEKNILTITFNDPYNKTNGGSCRSKLLWLQIEATAKQFSGVEEVRFSPDYLFQP